MAEKRIGIIMNGVTGRMGTNQHLVRSILAIRKQGGVPLADGDVIMPEPLLVGRNDDKLQEPGRGPRRRALDHRPRRGPRRSGASRSTSTPRSRSCARADVRKAIARRQARSTARSPSPTPSTDALAHRPSRRAEAGVKNGVVQDKLWLPGLLKLKYLIDTGFFGRILSVRGEFGYWVFDGDHQPAQRPSWNYRKEEGGGIIIDMLCHWRYVIDNLFGADQGAVGLRRASTSRAHRRGGARVRLHGRRRGLRHLRARQRRASATSTPPGACGCAATTC